ncbi:hypothetical protein AK812_SmicGene46642 [Symbiodinium microadriaticum]|uniref:Uncharacterized protein n=1 Tax=Symbiodinium microadriaticum TaxID=2951 RepID=A0A1Q9BTI0_SYMMI|nr:hypothetical protein AK812_SmicGene46642 [Symbiodinium microadriaticum]
MHNQASNLKRVPYQIFSILDGFGQIAFVDLVSGCLKFQMQYMQDGLHLLKQAEKFRKLGSDPAGRLKNDVRWGGLVAYLKQSEGLRAVQQKATKALENLATADPTQHAKIKELCFSDLDRPFQMPEDIKEAIVLAMKEMQKNAEELIDKVGDITHDLHIPKFRWTKDLKHDATVETVKMCISSTLDFDVSPLEPTLQSLKEVNSKIVLWKKKVAFLKEAAELEAECEAFVKMCEKVKEHLFNGYVFRSEGVFANALLERNKAEAQTLVRAELSCLQSDHWNLGLDDTHVHPAVLAAAKQLLERR